MALFYKILVSYVLMLYPLGYLGTFSPKSISNMVAWLDVQSSTITKDGSNLVASITDLSGSSNTYTQGTSGSKPTYVANDGDGLPCISHNGKFLTATNSLTSVTEETIFMVVKVNAVSGTAKYLFGPSTGNGGAWHDNTTTPPQLNWATGASTIDATGAIRNVYDCNIGTYYKILRFRRKQGTGRDGFMEAYENSYLMRKDIHSNGSYTYTNQIGCKNSSTSTLASNIKWRAYLHYNAALTDGQCAQIEGYLNARYNVFTLPSWAANELPQVKRYAIANAIASAGAMPGGNKYYWGYIGDSTCTGYAPAAGFDSKYIQAFANSDIYEYNVASAWQALNTTNTASFNNKALAQGYAGMEATLSWEIENASRKGYVNKYGIPGATLANDGTDNNWNISLNTSNYPTKHRRYLDQSINAEVCLNGTRLINMGYVIFLGTNDAVVSYYASVQSNMTDLINFIRGIQGFAFTRVAICDVYSSSGSYPYISNVKTALAATASALPSCTLIPGAQNNGGTVDNTHPNGTTYGTMGTAIYTYLG